MDGWMDTLIRLDAFSCRFRLSAFLLVPLDESSNSIAKSAMTAAHVYHQAYMYKAMRANAGN